MNREERNSMIKAMIEAGSIKDQQLPARYDRVVTLAVAVGSELDVTEEDLLDWRVLVCVLEGGEPSEGHRETVDQVLKRIANQGKDAMDVHEACLHYDHLTYEDALTVKEAIERMHQTEVVPFKDEVVAALARVGPLITPIRDPKADKNSAPVEPSDNSKS